MQVHAHGSTCLFQPSAAMQVRAAIQMQGQLPFPRHLGRTGTQRTVDSGPTGEVQNYDACPLGTKLGAVGTLSMSSSVCQIMDSERRTVGPLSRPLASRLL